AMGDTRFSSLDGDADVGMGVVDGWGVPVPIWVGVDTGVALLVHARVMRSTMAGRTRFVVRRDGIKSYPF
ncbi:MAG: hypothetical protein QGI09_10145, partial [Dehalococcoidia bacterium]|nr:hypothetical protein [Dehalococcoidia bacterium]